MGSEARQKAGPNPRKAENTIIILSRKSLEDGWANYYFGVI
jgi:hypothetical protein